MVGRVGLNAPLYCWMELRLSPQRIAANPPYLRLRPTHTQCVYHALNMIRNPERISAHPHSLHGMKAIRPTEAG